jgi:hypothetical protein
MGISLLEVLILALSSRLDELGSAFDQDPERVCSTGKCEKH